jgi:hypothetical protein
MYLHPLSTFHPVYTLSKHQKLVSLVLAASQNKKTGVIAPV